MIDQFIDSALIIDDDYEEIKQLQFFLEEKDIWVKHFSPPVLESRKIPFKNRKIIFIDLYLNDADTSKNNIAKIRKYLKDFIGKNFGTYGLVLWTKHLEHLDAFREKVSLDFDVYSTPIFIIGLDKTKYLEKGNYNDVLADLDIELSKNLAASFFIKWNAFVMEGNDKALLNIYSLVRDYSLQDQNLKFILIQLAKNYSGVPIDKLANHNLTQDAIKAFTDMLNYEIISSTNDNNFLFNQITELFYKYKFDAETNYEYSSNNHLTGSTDNKSILKNKISITKKGKKENPQKDAIENLEKELLNIYSNINSKLLIDIKNLNQQIVIPGNVYSVTKDSPFKISMEGLPADSIPIIMEVTPPCDFSNDKKGSISRVVSGYICNYSNENISSLLKGDNIYKEFYPVLVDSVQPKIIVLDFKYFGSTQEDELKNIENFKLIFRTKDKLFADILQKLSSHTARLGLAVIH